MSGSLKTKKSIKYLWRPYKNSQKLGNTPFTQLSLAGDITTVQLKILNYSRKGEVGEPFTEIMHVSWTT